ncbi:MAG TPA: type 1 glutamine amidotransferase, partial [Azonexus sp.]|nr:type 1 glutamine amidotransferase [Azonexus sp.]
STNAMQPVAIFRHSPTEGPGYFAIFLEQQGIPWQLIAIDEGEGVPATADGFSGLCFMGGPMSVNDPLPWIDSVCALIRNAIAKDVPVIGHCLGGQLMSKALGGEVTRNPVKEIGWSEASGEDNAIGRQWLGARAGQSHTIFQWHGETFSIPPGASRLLANTHCVNQMFALGPHLGMQCHVEMTPEMIATWCGQWADEAIAVADQPSVQTPDVMQQEISNRLPAMRQLSEQLYSVWIRGLRR